MTEILEEITFAGWPKIARLNREVVVTEKLDGTNAAIIVTEDGRVAAQSRKRLITPEDDNFGFARWVYENAEEFAVTLGPGRHFGEWWGSGIQRGYGLLKGERRFSLFNALRWTGHDRDNYSCAEVPLCYVVPVIPPDHLDPTGFDHVSTLVYRLRQNGSYASPGFMNPEGVIACHKQSNTSFKVTLEKDEAHKFEAT